MARHLGVSTLTAVVSPALRQHGTRRAKEEAEVGVTRVQQLQGTGVSSVQVGGFESRC